MAPTKHDLSSGVLWKIWYDDRPPFSNLDGEPKDAPAGGVQCIVQVDFSEHRVNTGRVILHRKDWYWWDDRWGIWNGGDYVGWVDSVLQGYCSYAPKFGRSVMPRGRFLEICENAMKDPDFPEYSGTGIR